MAWRIRNESKKKCARRRDGSFSWPVIISLDPMCLLTSERETKPVNKLRSRQEGERGMMNKRRRRSGLSFIRPTGVTGWDLNIEDAER